MHRLLAFVVGLLLLVTAAARADKPTWEPVGLSAGGGMFHPVISPRDSKVAMVHCDMSDVFITRDGGETWKMVNAAQLRSNTRCRGAFLPKDPNTIFSPHGASAIRVSKDGGRTWKDFATFDEPLAGEISINPTGSTMMVVGAGKGLRITMDGGTTWERVKGPTGTYLSGHTGAESAFFATTEGIWRTRDGRVFEEMSDGLPSKELRGFAGGTKDGKTTLYVTLPGKEEGGKYVGGIYRWQSDAKKWESVMGPGLNMDLKNFDEWSKKQPAQYHDVATSDLNPEIVWATNEMTGVPPPHHATVYRSDDGGKNWRATFFPDPRYKGFNVEKTPVMVEDGQFYQHMGRLAIDPRDTEHVFQLQSSWAFYTLDGGKTWKSSNGHPVGEAKHNCAWVPNGLMLTSTWHYYIDPFEPKRHYICYTDMGFARSLDGGKTWIWWAHEKSSPWRNTCYDVAFDPEMPGKMWGAFSNMHDIPNGNIIYGRHGGPATRVGGICVSTDFADTWSVLKGGLPVKPATSVIVDPKSAKGSRTLYASFFGDTDGGVFKSTDDGKTWAAKNKGLGDATNMRVYRVAIHADGTLFALVTALTKNNRDFQPAGVGLYRSKDGAETWECISKNAPALWPKDFTVDPADSKVILIGLSDANNKQVGGLYRTKDAGASWELLTRQGPQTFGGYFHPKHPGWIYATLCEGSPQYGLYLSKDDGKTFSPIKDFPFGNPMRVVADPANAELIYVTTFGGSVWHGPAE